MNKKDFLSKIEGIESNIQDQINNKADIDHTHEDLVGGIPVEHTHESEDITDLSEILDQKADKSHTHTKSEITDFPSSLPANGGNADTVGGIDPNEFARKNGIHDSLISGGIKIIDTRNDNQPPSWYFANKATTIIKEFKSCNAIQLPGSAGMFCTLETITAWNDQSGGEITQIAYLDNQAPMIRHSSGTDLWSQWESIGGSKSGGFGGGRFVMPVKETVINLTTPGKEFHLPAGETYQIDDSDASVYYVFAYFVPEVTGLALLTYQGRNARFGTFAFDGYIGSYSEFGEYYNDSNDDVSFGSEQIDFSTVPSGSKFNKNLASRVFGREQVQAIYFSGSSAYETMNSVVKIRAGVPIVLFGMNDENRQVDSDYDIYVKDFQLVYKEVK